MAQSAGIPEEGIKEKDSILQEINKKIESAFDIFDHENNKTVDVRYSWNMHTCSTLVFFQWFLSEILLTTSLKLSGKAAC